MTPSVTFASKRFRWLVAALVLTGTTSSAKADNPRSNNGEINEHTVWVFRALPSVKLESSLIYLGDIAEPLDAKLAAWPRLSRKIIGLVPVGETTVTLDRERIAAVVNRAEAIPKTIRWFGPEQIKLQMVQKPAGPTRGSAAGLSDRVRPVDYQSERSLVADASAPGTIKAGEDAAIVAIEDPVIAQRMTGWILVALKRHQPDLVNQFEISLAKTAANNEAFSTLKAASGIVFANANTIDTSDPPTVNRDSPLMIPVSVTGRSVQGPVDAIVDFQIVPHPLVVAAARNIQRGDRITAADLKMIPLSRERWKEDYSSSVDDFIGMEVRGSARAEQPFSIQAVARPLMVRRGELIELRVSGGSILVTTNAKTLSDGREGELIEVETLEPKRRVAARVTGIGTAQITTRAPVVRNRR